MNLGPENAGGIEEDKIVIDADFLQSFGNSGLVACLGHFATSYGIYQRGFPHIGDAGDHGQHMRA